MTNRKVSAAAEGVSVTLSQRVNALLASYVAIEAAQMPLVMSDDVKDDNRAADLGKSALAIRDEIRAIRDRSANPDLLAARILLDFMLDHQWTPEAGIHWGPEEEADALPALEILSGSLTGAVRHEARRALATIGVEIPEAEADPLSVMIADYLAQLAAHNAAELPDADAEAAHAAETWAPIYDRMLRSCPTPTTFAGVADAIRLALDRQMGDDIPAFAESLLRAALTHLDGRA